MWRAYKIRKLKLTDHEKLPSVTILRSDSQFYFHKGHDKKEYKTFEDAIDSLIANTETAAFLVIRNDSLVYEKYFMGFHSASILPSNSMAKSFIGTLTGIALYEGKILSVDEPITNYIPELANRDSRFRNITLQHLLDMCSGLDFNEETYDLKDDAIRIGLKRNLVKHLLKTKIKEHPGNFNYQSINTMLLGLLIERASGQKLQDYFQEKLWKAINTEQNATWNVDSKKRKHLLTSAGLNATTVDFAKLGRLYLYKGILSGKTIIDSEWINTVTNADTMEKHEGYKYQCWNKKGKKHFQDTTIAFEEKSESKKLKKDYGVDHSYFLDKRTNAFNAFGFMEQILYVNPQKNLIIVRIGRGWPDKRTFTHSIYELGEKF